MVDPSRFSGIRSNLEIMHFVQSLSNGGQCFPESLDFDRKYWWVALGENLIKIKLAVLKENVALELDVLVCCILGRLRVIASVFAGRHVILDVRCYIFQCSKSMLETAQVLRHAAKSAKSMIRVLLILIVFRLG